MAQPTSLTTITQADYEAIESAVMETVRGRWFLGEFARRNRTADTQVLLDAIGRLEQVVTTERSNHDLDRLRFDLVEMAKAISLTKTEIAAIRPMDREHSRLIAASEALDAITRTTERATSEILEAAEHIQEAAWTLRENGADAALCGELDRRATEIYTACSFQDITAQSMAKIVHTLRYLEGRINAMIEIWGGTTKDTEPMHPAPDLRPIDVDRPDLNQSDIDIVIVTDDLFAGPGVRSDARFAVSRPSIDGPFLEADIAFIDVTPPAESSPDNLAANATDRPPLRMEAFAEIDALDPQEKLKRFT